MSCISLQNSCPTGQGVAWGNLGLFKLHYTISALGRAPCSFGQELYFPLFKSIPETLAGLNMRSWRQAETDVSVPDRPH